MESKTNSRLSVTKFSGLEIQPPAASHMGEIWERTIRSIRNVLKGLLKEQTVTDESLTTLMCEVEAILNGHPLTKVTSDPKYAETITSNHLLLLCYHQHNFARRIIIVRTDGNKCNIWKIFVGKGG